MRLRHQRLIDSPCRTPQLVVAWLGAVQAQEYGFASWALALRSTGVTQAGVDAALASGAIIRTHVLRPTWHFVTPPDLRWMLALTGPRIVRAMTSYDNGLELDARVYAKAIEQIVRALEGGQQRTRKELAAALATRYFRSHGPATIRDFSWWSGLTITDCRAAVDLPCTVRH